MLTVTVVIAFGLTVGIVAIGDVDQQPAENITPTDSSSSDEASTCNESCGPFFCQARCVASCLETGAASSIAQCAQEFCNDFDENTPCKANDTKCWKTCGFEPTLGDQPPPRMVENLREDAYKDGFSSSGNNPYTLGFAWEPTPEASLYVIEINPMIVKNLADNYNKDNQPMIRNMTTDTSYSLPRDLCTVYMARVTSVNSYGLSVARYFVVDAWKPELHYDENFNVKSITREDDIVKVMIQYKQPETWRDGDAKLETSTVLARKCSGPLNDTIFMSTEPDDNGYFMPLVFINETGNLVELSFPSQIMQSKCLFSYRVTGIRTRCNTTVITDSTAPSAAGADFAISCKSVKNSGCGEMASIEESSDDKNVADGAGNYDNEDDRAGAVAIDPEANKETETETSTPSSDERTTRAAVVDSSSSEEVHNKEPVRQGNTTNNDELGGEIFAAAEELDKATKTTTVSAVDTTESNSIFEPSQEKSEPAGDSDKEFDGDDAPGEPALIIIEPRDPNAPACKLADFNAEIESSSDSSNETVDLILSWMEMPSLAGLTQTPNYFLIRYGPVMRTLVFDPQADMVMAEVTRTPKPSDPDADAPRAFKVTGLTPKELFAFQICAVYSTSPDPMTLWDSAEKHFVDLSATDDDLIPVDIPPMARLPPPSSSGQQRQQLTESKPDEDAKQADNSTDMGLLDFFFDVMNSSFEATQEITKPDNKDPSISASNTAGLMGAPSNPGDDASSFDDDIAVFEVNVPAEPTVLNVDVKPVVITEQSPSSWAHARAFWFLAAMSMLALTIAAAVMFTCKRRNRRTKWRNQYEPSVADAFSLPKSNTPTTQMPESKVPMP